jgi:hypothetical protein
MVPELLFGNEYGVGTDRRLGTVTTTTLTDYAFPRDLPGEWVMVASRGETVGDGDMLRFALRHVVAGQLDWGSRILVRPGTEWFAEGYGLFRGSAQIPPFGFFSFALVRQDGTRASIVFASVGDAVFAPDIEGWFGLHVRYPDAQSGTARPLGGGSLQFQIVEGAPRLWARASLLPDPPAEATYGTLVGERDPFDAMLRGNPPDAPPPRLASEIVISVSGSMKMFWTKLWVRA